MSDEAALLKSIIAHPDEDTPRLVYADWLDENKPDAVPSPAAGPSARAELHCRSVHAASPSMASNSHLRWLSSSDASQVPTRLL